MGGEILGNECRLNLRSKRKGLEPAHLPCPAPGTALPSCWVLVAPGARCSVACSHLSHPLEKRGSYPGAPHGLRGGLQESQAMRRQ